MLLSLQFLSLCRMFFFFVYSFSNVSFFYYISYLFHVFGNTWFLQQVISLRYVSFAPRPQNISTSVAISNNFFFVSIVLLLLFGYLLYSISTFLIILISIIYNTNLWSNFSLYLFWFFNTVFWMIYIFFPSFQNFNNFLLVWIASQYLFSILYTLTSNPNSL